MGCCGGEEGLGRAVGSEEWCGSGDSVDDVVCSSAAGSRGIRIEGEVQVGSSGAAAAGKKKISHDMYTSIIGFPPTKMQVVQSYNTVIQVSGPAYENYCRSGRGEGLDFAWNFQASQTL